MVCHHLGNFLWLQSGVLFDRHSFCTQLVEDGVPLPTIKNLARHADIRTTQKYVHPTDESARTAVNYRGRGKGAGKVVDLKSKTKAKRDPEDK
jgi:hypothetical protein